MKQLNNDNAANRTSYVGYVYNVGEKEYKNQLKLNKKNKKLYNYQFLSDYYRRQLNKVLLNFNPIKHLENINILRKENPQINEEFNEKTKKIEGEIFHKTSPNFFQKNSKNS